ncbi:MAG: hypothetical protein OET18_17205, partial [Desulfobacterales bacterium]|nr:hypothetical protein [Desulfobacterales bacterium]
DSQTTLGAKLQAAPFPVSPPFIIFFIESTNCNSRFNIFFRSRRGKKKQEILFLDLNREGYRPASKWSPAKALNAEYCYLYGVDSFVKSRAELNQNF